MLKSELTVNPIAERADALRTQAATDGGLCDIQIPIYADTDTADSFLSTVVSSVTASADCVLDVCRSEGCHVCVDENGGEPACELCATSTNCDGKQNVVEYRYCDCDVVVTVNEKSEFSLLTGKEIVHP